MNFQKHVMAAGTWAVKNRQPSRNGFYSLLQQPIQEVPEGLPVPLWLGCLAFRHKRSHCVKCAKFGSPASLLLVQERASLEVARAALQLLTSS